MTLSKYIDPASKSLLIVSLSVGALIVVIGALVILAVVRNRYQKRAKDLTKIKGKLAISLKDHLLDNVTLIKEVSKKQGTRRYPSHSGSTSDSGTCAGSNVMNNSTDSEVIAPSNLGLLEFSVSYDGAEKNLTITVVKCLDLTAKDGANGTADPYVKLQLLPDKKHRVKTNLVHKSLNPVYNERFVFSNFSLNQVQATSLHFVVLSYDRFSRDEVIGEFVYPLNSLSSDISAKGVNIVREIMPRKLKLDPIHGNGDILVSLCYQPMTNRLSVVVLKARNLPKMNVTSIPIDPYVKLSLYNGEKQIGKKKTHVKKQTLNPVYNETFMFDLPTGQDIGELRMELQVIDWDRVTNSEILGRVVIGEGSETELGHVHWKEMLENPCKQFAEWHPLIEEIEQ